jgi:hypothetical protein
MAGYAVSARLRGAEPQVVAWTMPKPLDPRATLRAATEMNDEVTPIDLVGEPFGSRVAEWLAGIGDAWSQTVFFLFDPDSWR